MNAILQTVILATAALMFLTANGCATSTYGTKLDPVQVHQIEKGKSTRADVEALLGRSPMPPTATPDGSRTLVYTFGEAEAKTDIWRNFIPYGLGGHGSDVTRRTQLLTIYIAPNGVVKDYEFSDTTADTREDTSIFTGGHSTTTVRPEVSQSN